MTKLTTLTIALAVAVAGLGACGDSGGATGTADTADATSSADTTAADVDEDATVADTGGDDAADTAGGEDVDADDVGDAEDGGGDAADTADAGDTVADTADTADAAGCPEGEQDNDHDGVCAPACATDSCSGHGDCADNLGAVVCVCYDGYDGDACETDVDDCAGVTCASGGTCVDEVSGYHCECATGYDGDLCEVCAEGYEDDDGDGVCAPSCAMTTCNEHASCSVVAGEATCACDDGWRDAAGDGVCVESTCGDQVIDPGNDEECEPGVFLWGDFCGSDCKIDCSAIGDGFDTLELTTGCYFDVPTTDTFITYDDATTACAYFGAHVVTLDNAYENLYVSEHFGQFWIGLQPASGGGFPATWVTGEELDYKDTTGWDPELDTDLGDPYCVQSRSGLWDSLPCDRNVDIVCERDTCGDGVVTSNEECDDGNEDNGDGCDENCTFPACGNGIVDDGEDCDDGNLVDGDQCPSDCDLACGATIDDWENIATTTYGCYLRFAANRSWTSAQTECLGRGGVLALPTSRAQEEIFFVMTAGNNFWAGASDRDVEGSWVDLDGDELAGYIHWTAAAPNTNSGRDCLIVNQSGWNSENCSNTHKYICEFSTCGNGTIEWREECDDGDLEDGDGCDSNCAVTGCGNGVVTAGETCDDGNTVDGDGCSSTCQLPCDASSGADRAWVGDNGHCYSRFDTDVTMTTAAFNCQQFGAHLVSIGSAEEDAFVFAQVGENGLVGAGDSAEEGVFLWDDNSDTSAYSHWNSGEPNDGSTGEDCTAYKGDGSWNDIDCAKIGRYVCESEPLN